MTSSLAQPSLLLPSPPPPWCLGEALRRLFFTNTVTTPPCCRNSSTTSPVLLDREGEDVIELNVCRTRRCRAFGTWIGRIVKTYDYINRVDKRFRLAIFKGMKIHSPLVAMHHHDLACV